MTEMFRCRVDKDLLARAHQVSDAMGTSTSELVRIFLKALVKRKELPFSPSAQTEAEATMEEVFGPVERRRKMMNFFADGN